MKDEYLMETGDCKDVGTIRYSSSILRPYGCLEIISRPLRDIYPKPKVPPRQWLSADRSRLRIPMTLRLLHQETHLPPER